MLLYSETKILMRSVQSFRSLMPVHPDLPEVWVLKK
jgi:hypothetical protein